MCSRKRNSFSSWLYKRKDANLEKEGQEREAHETYKDRTADNTMGLTLFRFQTFPLGMTLEEELEDKSVLVIKETKDNGFLPLIAEQEQHNTWSCSMLITQSRSKMKLKDGHQGNIVSSGKLGTDKPKLGNLQLSSYRVFSGSGQVLFYFIRLYAPRETKFILFY